jgi:hypothetical protein
MGMEDAWRWIALIRTSSVTMWCGGYAQVALADCDVCPYDEGAMTRHGLPHQLLRLARGGGEAASDHS